MITSCQNPTDGRRGGGGGGEGAFQVYQRSSQVNIDHPSDSRSRRVTIGLAGSSQVIPSVHCLFVIIFPSLRCTIIP